MRTVIAAILFAVPAFAQESAPQVVVVPAGITARPAPPTKVVRVPPAPDLAPEGAYEGTRRYHDWRYFRGGLAQSRASYAIWRTRFRPVHPFRSVPRYFQFHAWR